MRRHLRKFGNYCDRLCCAQASWERLFPTSVLNTLNNLDFISSGVPGPNLRAAAAALNCLPETLAPGAAKASSSTLLSARVGISHNSQRPGRGPSPAPSEVCVAGVN